MRESASCTARFGSVAVVVVLLFGAIGATEAYGSPKHHEQCVAGAAGVGDAYYPSYGNGGYDVSRYDLDVAYDPATDVLDGKATITATATERLCSFNLDLVGLELRSVTVNGPRASWTRSGQELVITPKHPLKQGKRFRVIVRYGGVPVEFVLPGFGIRTGFMATPDGVTVAGQPEVAAAWYPVNDHPLDKASYSFEVTVPKGYEVVANGVLRDVDLHKGSATWEWEAVEPMASYLATIDVGFWDVHVWETASGLPVYDAVDSAITGELRAVIDASLARQGEVIDVLSDAFGPYPFGTTGAIVDNQDDLFFALETQTRPVYSKYFWFDAEGNPTNGDFVVVHELAHQWFGDDLALARWQDIWLNEGFATYAEWIWAEHEGQATPQQIFEETYAAIPAEDPFWSVVIGDPGIDLLFDGAVYVRGAMTLQALRNDVGDNAFWQIIRGWADTHSGGNVTTEQFTSYAERVSGQQLDELFTTWLFTPTKPELAAVAAQRAPAAARAGSTRWLTEAQRRIEQGRH